MFLKGDLYLKCVLLVILFRPSSVVVAQGIEYHKVAKQSLTSIYLGKYDSASYWCQQLPDSKAGLKKVIESFSMRWQYIPVHMSSQGNKYHTKLSEAIQELKKIKQPKPEDVYLHITAELLLSEYFYNQEETTKALWHSKRAYPFIVQALDDTDEEPELLFIKGMYLYYMDFFRQKSFFYRAGLFPFRDGNVAEGIKLLEKVASIPSLAQTEALIYCSHIYLHLENKPALALPYSQQLVAKFPENLKFRELLIDNLIAIQRYQEAEDMLELQLKTNDAYFLIPALFFKGSACFAREGKTEKAKKLFEECIKLARKNSLWKSYEEKAREKLEDGF